MEIPNVEIPNIVPNLNDVLNRNLLVQAARNRIIEQVKPIDAKPAPGKDNTDLFLEKRQASLTHPNLGHLLASEDTYRDFTVKVGEKSFPVHKCVISASSPVFARMLSPGFVESEQGALEIGDFTPEVFEAALKFIYYGKFMGMAMTSDLLIGLFLFANKYQMENLKMYCFQTSKRIKSKFKFEERRDIVHELAVLDRETFGIILAVLGPFEIEN